MTWNFRDLLRLVLCPNLENVQCTLENNAAIGWSVQYIHKHTHICQVWLICGVIQIVSLLIFSLVVLSTIEVCSFSYYLYATPFFPSFHFQPMSLDLKWVSWRQLKLFHFSAPELVYYNFHFFVDGLIFLILFSWFHLVVCHLSSPSADWAYLKKFFWDLSVSWFTLFLWTGPVSLFLCMSCHLLLGWGIWKDTHLSRSLQTAPVQGKAFTNQPGMKVQGSFKYFLVGVSSLGLCVSALTPHSQQTSCLTPTSQGFRYSVVSVWP